MLAYWQDVVAQQANYAPMDWECAFSMDTCDSEYPALSKRLVRGRYGFNIRQYYEPIEDEE